ncbi:TOMM precursor leader peptide-binding protein [Plantactinospora sp. B5E13]|uniref:TOMM precursor leader peptide-binding protein n=1 Tax=Plantactinospora sp. B5E13 TaxID=3153758 RepID=UPI00325DB3ED
MRRPRFRADYQPVPVAGDDGDYLVVVGEERNLLIEDPVAAELAPLLDGTRDVGVLTAALAPRHPVAAVAGALRRMAELGLLTYGPTGVGAARAAGWDAREIAPDAAEWWGRTGQVLLVDAGSPGLRGLAAALTGCVDRVEVVDVTARDLTRRLRDFAPTGAAPTGPADGHGTAAAGPVVGPAGLVVAVPGSVLDPRLAALNRACLDAGVPWTLVRPHGGVLVLGPHLVPDETGCWECLRQRWTDNEQVESFLAGHAPDRPRPVAARAALPATSLVAAGLLAAELPVLGLTGRSARLTGRMLTFDTRDHTATPHELVRQPQCPACGDPDLTRKADARIVLTGGTPTGETDGGTRLRHTADTYRLLSRHVSRYLGVVTRLDALDEEENLTYSYLSGHNFALARHPVGLRKSLRGLSGGKGRTRLQAKVSAIGEAIERYSAVWRADRPVHRASYAQLGADRAVHLRDLLLFSDRQYRDRDRFNRSGGHFHQVPLPQPDDREIDWSTGWSLTADAPREIPAAYCWYGHPEVNLGICGPDSNGCAAGATVSEAILQGFCELVERDAVALWWYHRSRVPGVDLDSFTDPWIDALRRHYADTLARDLWVLDVTADLGVPTYAAVSRHTARPTEDVIVGFGAHLDPRVALGRALTELNQFLPIVSRFLDGRTRYGVTDPDTVRWYRTVRVAEQPWLAPDPTTPPSTVATRPSLTTGDVAGDVRHCVSLAADAGLEVIVLNQSRPELELAVVKVLVPGLRHFWRRLGPGRLWTVPARLGRTPYAADEDAVNPLSVFF